MAEKFGLEAADKKAEERYGESFCAVAADGTHEVFEGDCMNAILMGQGTDWEDAFAQADQFRARFPRSVNG